VKERGEDEKRGFLAAQTLPLQTGHMGEKKNEKGNNRGTGMK